MVELITEILIYLGIAALLGLVLGYLIWGSGTAARVSAARADGAAAARTSVDGNAGLREQLASAESARARLEDEVDRLSVALDACERKHRDAAAASDNASEGIPAIAPVAFVPGEDDAFKIEAEPEPEQLPEPETVPSAEADDAPEPEPQVEPSPEVEPEAEPEAALEPDAPILPEGLLSERPDEVDDLKQIKGVGKVMESVLNDKGIYLFRQVAALTEQEVAWVNDAIEAFPGRIQRDRWVEQAAQLYADKYGKPYDEDG